MLYTYSIQPSARIYLFFTACPGRKFLGSPVSLTCSYWPVGKRAVAVSFQSGHRRNFPSTSSFHLFCILSLVLTGKRLVARRAEKSLHDSKAAHPRLSPHLDSARFAVTSSQLTARFAVLSSRGFREHGGGLRACWWGCLHYFCWGENQKDTPAASTDERWRISSKLLL